MCSLTWAFGVEPGTNKLAKTNHSHRARKYTRCCRFMNYLLDRDGLVWKGFESLRDQVCSFDMPQLIGLLVKCS